MPNWSVEKGKKTNHTLISLSHGARAPRGDSTETQVLPSTKTQTHTHTHSLSHKHKRSTTGALELVFKAVSLFAYHTLILAEKLAQKSQKCIFWGKWLANRYAFVCFYDGGFESIYSVV